MAKINYQDKVALNPLPSIPNENKVTDADMNEIKASVNWIYDNPVDVTEIEVGTTPINSGIEQAVLFQSGGVVQQSNLFKFDPATGRFNINNVASPIAQINAKATDNLSSSYFMVLREPTDTFNRFVFANNGDITIRASGTNVITNYLNSGAVSKVQIGVAGNEAFLDTKAFMSVSSTDNRNASASVYGKGKFWIGGVANAPVLPSENSTNVLFVKFGTNPALNYASGYQQYAAGSSSQWYPEFRLSDGKVVKLEPQDSTSIATLTDLVNALTTMGILY